MKIFRKVHGSSLPKIYQMRGVCDIRRLAYGQTLTGVETAFSVFGGYCWLVEKALNVVAFNRGSDALAASSIAEAFHVLDVLHSTPLIDVLDGFYYAILCYLPRTHIDASGIISWILRKKARTLTYLPPELTHIAKGN